LQPADENAAKDIRIKSKDEKRLVELIGTVDSNTIAEALKATLIVVGY
jgi:hypothetical protein